MHLPERSLVGRSECADAHDLVLTATRQYLDPWIRQFWPPEPIRPPPFRATVSAGAGLAPLAPTAGLRVTGAAAGSWELGLASDLTVPTRLNADDALFCRDACAAPSLDLLATGGLRVGDQAGWARLTIGGGVTSSWGVGFVRDGFALAPVAVAEGAVGVHGVGLGLRVTPIRPAVATVLPQPGMRPIVPGVGAFVAFEGPVDLTPDWLFGGT